jgi:hypothetical protein
MIKKRSLETRLLALEKRAEGSHIPGTQLVRICLPNGGFSWSLALGPMQGAKSFFIAKTIKEVIIQAEQAFI